MQRKRFCCCGAVYDRFRRKRSENIGIELLDEGKKDRCAIRITPDEEWLKDPERVYPVIVDPITTTSKDVKEIIDACVDSQDAAGTDREGMYLKTRGGDIIQRSYLKFKLPMIKTGDMVINARMLMVSLAKRWKRKNCSGSSCTAGLGFCQSYVDEQAYVFGNS